MIHEGPDPPLGRHERRASLPIFSVNYRDIEGDMKTPDDFAQVMNDRGADRSSTAKPRKPTAIIVTIVFALFTMAVGVVGFVHLAFATGGLVQNDGSILALIIAYGLELTIVGFAAATLFACFKRPGWGRAVSITFALGISTFIGYVIAFPDPHPVFQITDGMEQVGAYAGRALMVFGIAVYTWLMIMGAKTRAYFAAT